MTRQHQPDPFAPVTNLGEGDALESWRFLVGRKAQVRLLTPWEMCSCSDRVSGQRQEDR